MARSEKRNDSGGTYTAKVRKRQKTKIKRRKRWSIRRIASIIGFTAAFFAVISLISSEWQARVMGILGSIYNWILVVRTTLNELINPLVPLPQMPYIQGLGDILLLLALIAILVLLLRVSEPTVARKIDEMMMEWKVKQETTQQEEDIAKASQEVPTPPPPYMAFVPMGYPQQPGGRAAKTLQLSASAVVNAPRGQVWELLNEVIYVPTCQELLESVEVLGKIANALTWEGKVRAGRRKFPVEGTTTLYPPTRMEVVCTRGALQGFKGVLSLSEVPEGTRLTETAEFDPASLPDEYTPVANALSTRGSEILAGDLEHFRRLIKALMSPGEPE